MAKVQIFINKSLRQDSFMVDWLGNSVRIGDHIVMPSKQGSSGPEQILYKVLEIGERDGNRSVAGDSAFFVKAEIVTSSRAYGSTYSNGRKVTLSIMQNVTKVDVKNAEG